MNLKNNCFYHHYDHQYDLFIILLNFDFFELLIELLVINIFLVLNSKYILIYNSPFFLKQNKKFWTCSGNNLFAAFIMIWDILNWSSYFPILDFNNSVHKCSYKLTLWILIAALCRVINGCRELLLLIPHTSEQYNN